MGRGRGEGAGVRLLVENSLVGVVTGAKEAQVLECMGEPVVGEALALKEGCNEVSLGSRKGNTNFCGTEHYTVLCGLKTTSPVLI